MILRSIGMQSDAILQAMQNQFGDEYFYSWNSFRIDAWAEQAYKKSIETNKPIMCAETPLIGRKLFNENSPDTYYRIGINIVSSWLEKNFFVPRKVTPDRLEAMLEQTHTKLLPWRKSGDHIIYAMQVPADSSLLGLDIFAAAQYDLTFLRQITDRPIYITMHPDLQKTWAQHYFEKNKQHFDGFARILENTKSHIVKNSTESLFNNAWCTVCHTSGVGFDSIAAGIPVVALSNRSFVTDLAGNSYYDVLEPPTPERIPVLSKLAYCQWTLQEVERGIFKEHVNNIRR